MIAKPRTPFLQGDADLGVHPGEVPVHHHGRAGYDAVAKPHDLGFQEQAVRTPGPFWSLDQRRDREKPLETSAPLRNICQSRLTGTLNMDWLRRVPRKSEYGQFIVQEADPQCMVAFSMVR